MSASEAGRAPAATAHGKPAVLLVVAGSLLMVSALGAGLDNHPSVVLGRHWPPAERVSMDRIDHAAWNGLLRRYVDGSGNVNYALWKANPADVVALDDYLGSLSRANLDAPVSRDVRLAFWINAYNAVAVRGILREYPTASIQDHVAAMFGYNIWRDLRLAVGGRQFSLGQIEHELLRPMREPRTHFAIVCSSRGCPRLRNDAYRAETLNDQLDQNSRDFFADPTKFRRNAETGELNLSPILEWYADDFGRTPAERLQAIGRYLPDKTSRDRAASGKATVKFLDYDWRLNEQPRPSDEPPLPPE